jgi:predicted dehydrogenase
VKRVNVGVIGLGEVAQIIHLPILEALPDRFRVTAICDVSPALLSQVGDRYGVPEAARHRAYEELVARADVDAVLVLNSDEYHADCTIAAVGHGKHVLVEKPICLTIADAERIVRAQDQAGVQVMVAYMRRFAPAFLAAVEEVRRLDRINYVRVRDIIGRNRLVIEQSSFVHRPDDVPADLAKDRAERASRMVAEAIGEAPPELVRAYRLLCGLNSHDISAMRELIGVPRRVAAAAQWNGGSFLNVLFAYDGYCAMLETGVDEQRRFDAHIEVYGSTASVRVQYDTPYIRHLPTTLVVRETVGDAYTERVARPTFTDPYTRELEEFHRVVTENRAPKTTPEDSIEDLRLFQQIVAALRSDRAGTSPA